MEPGKLGGLANMANTSHGNGPAGGDIGGLLALIQQHPNLPSSFVMGLLGASSQASVAQQQAADARRQGLSSLLTNAAMQPGMTPDMLQGLAGASYPKVAEGKFGQNAISGLSAALPGPRSSNFDDADKAILGNTLMEQFGQTATDPNDAQTLYEMRATALKTAISSGYDPIGQEQAVTFAEQVFASMTGADPEVVNQMGRPGFTPPGVPSTGVVPSGPAPPSVTSRPPGGSPGALQGPLAGTPLMDQLSKLAGYPN